MFLKHFFHASLGDFSHLEGGQVRIKAESPKDLGLMVLLMQVMQQLSAVSEHLSKKGPMAQVPWWRENLTARPLHPHAAILQDLAEGCNSDEWSE